ncbi:LPXTG cell wall anchor domain-containing protein, partial [Escherichia coli]|nr:LPXTG cell wall anchor domain-containing protein [Escherichia coli]
PTGISGLGNNQTSSNDSSRQLAKTGAVQNISGILIGICALCVVTALTIKRRIES